MVVLRSLTVPGPLVARSDLAKNMIVLGPSELPLQKISQDWAPDLGREVARNIGQFVGPSHQVVFECRHFGTQSFVFVF